MRRAAAKTVLVLTTIFKKRFKNGSSLAGNRGRVEYLGGLWEGLPFFCSSGWLASPPAGWVTPALPVNLDARVAWHQSSGCSFPSLDNGYG